MQSFTGALLCKLKLFVNKSGLNSVILAKVKTHLIQNKVKPFVFIDHFVGLMMVEKVIILNAIL